MGILEEKNMLYFLAFRIFMCLLIPTLIFADEQRVDFFKKRSVFVQSEDCSECSKGPNLLNPDLKAKSEEIESIVTGSFAKKQSQLTNEIILFVDPGRGASEAAVKAMVKFKKDNPIWKIKGVIVTDVVGLKEKLLSRRSWFDNDIEFSIDLNGSLVKVFAITETPSCVINYHGTEHKISGYTDLNEAISKLDK